MFDQLFFNVFNYYKNRKHKQANAIAIFYITLLHSAVLLFLGVFFAEFLKQMKGTSLNATNIWIIYGVLVIAIYFKNWIQYSGLKRNVKKAKLAQASSAHRSIVVLWLFPILCFALSFIFLNLV